MAGYSADEPITMWANQSPVVFGGGTAVATSAEQERARDWLVECDGDVGVAAFAAVPAADPGEGACRRDPGVKRVLGDFN